MHVGEIEGERAVAIGTRTKSLVTLLCLLLLAGPGLGRPPRAADLEWTKVETPHLRLYSSVRDSKTREVAEGLQLLRATLEVLFPRLDDAAEDPVTLFLFDENRDYRPYSRALAGDADTIPGHLVAHPLGEFIALDAYPPEGAWSQPVAFHEMTHAYLENRYPAVPAWLHEGLAEYFSTFQALGDAVQVGAPHPEHVRSLRRQRFVPWEEILATEETPRGEAAGRFYSQSWLLVHFLRHREEGEATDVRRYLEALAGGRDPDETFRKIFDAGACPSDGTQPRSERHGARVRAEGIPSMPVRRGGTAKPEETSGQRSPTGASLETPLRGYLNRSRFAMTDLPRAELAPVPKISIRPADTGEVLFRLGLLALGGGADEAATDHFEAAIRAEEPDARAGLAYLLEGRDPAAAEEEYRAAVAGGGDDPLTFHLYGRWLVRRLRGEVPGPAPELERTREVLSRAVELAPEDPRPRALLGTTWIFDDGPADRGIEHLLAARRARPGNPGTLFNLAMLYLKADQVEEADRLVSGPLAATGSPLTERATRELRRKTLETRVNEALGDHRPEDARRLVEEARARRPGLHADELERWLDRIDAQARRQRETAIYNEAIDFANFGKWKQVVEILGPLVEEGTVPDVVAAARKLLAEAERKAD